MSAENLTREPVQSLWIGPSLSAVERLCVSSFLAHGHPFHLYAYGEVGNVPSGATLCDARGILPAEDIFRIRRGGQAAGSLAGFSDRFRWRLLIMRRGWWVDMDLICLRPFSFSEEIVFGGSENGKFVQIGAVRMMFEHPLIYEMDNLAQFPRARAPWDSPLDRLRKFARRIRRGGGADSVRFGESGVRIMHRAVEHFDLASCVLPSSCFYPIPPSEWREVFRPGSAEKLTPRLANSFALHLWNERMRREGFDKNGTFPSDSLFERLRRDCEDRESAGK